MSHVGVSGSFGLVSPSKPAQQIRSLSGLSDRELLSRVRDLVSRERALTLEVLVHLIEVERRRLHLGLGYASMFDYCTRHFGYSSSAAGRRIQSARCIRDYPEAHGLLEKNEVNLVTISLVASILDESNAKDLIAKIRGKSQREVEAIVATYRPPVSMRDRAKPVCVAVPAPPALRISSTKSEHTPTAGSEKRPNTAAASFADGPRQATTEMQAQRKATPQPSSAHPSSSATTTEPEQVSPSPNLENKFFVQSLASRRFLKRLEKARALLPNGCGELSYEAVLEAALDEFLKDHDPDERNKRRQERKKKAEARTKSEGRVAEKTSGSRAKGGISSAECGPTEGLPCSSVQAGCGRVDDPLFRCWIGGLPASRVPANVEEPSRRIPAALRDAVFARDKRRCAYIGSTGKRCGATHHLQIDHIVPYARGGTNALGNLRLLCERHNKHEAERVLGVDIVRQFPPERVTAAPQKPAEYAILF
jgi:hypothetical protein